ncbi:PhoH family protein [Lujinxingia sediminis]|uniref:PhoH-like protein n=1 Tax=Lujinxingia sediminis TaxID=2480984 RepID=A0ABY0CXZ7_9DELT|nr:PhoH family protein [Lujinxingia sediminis]RVU48751.1 PhoH family protein [Lujinxingia sediminis]
MSDTDLVQLHLEFADAEVARYIYGHRDAFLKLIETRLDVRIGARGTEAHIEGAANDARVAERVLRQLYSLGQRGHHLSAVDVGRAIDLLVRDPKINLVDIFTDRVLATKHNQIISPKGLAQKAYVDAIRKHDVVFGIGPAGTGKTYLAMAMALSAYFSKSVKRIILTRPAVEAGEKLGFLPGDLAEKVNPYLRPLYDALHDMVELEKAEMMLERGVVEVAPLAFMRGRTLNDAFIIFDEAQNATNAQVKMFLTRIGFNSRAVITGDITQIDLPSKRMSGLVEAERVLDNIPGIAFCRFSQHDVVRHPLVQKIIDAYERNAQAEFDGARDRATSEES